MTDSTISGNNATEYSGAIHNNTGDSATVTDSTVSGNSATQFGGAFDNDGSLTVANSTVSGNSAGSGGGGIEMPSGATATVTNSTFWHNTASFGGSLDNDGGTLDVQATIVADSTSGSIVPTPNPPTSATTSTTTARCGFTGGTGDLSDTPSGLDPSGLQANGGPTKTIALEPGSAAIDAVADGSLCPATDQRGSNRGVPCDIGAYDTDLSPTISGVAFSGTSGSPTITVSGSGFGTESDLGRIVAGGVRLEPVLIYPAPSSLCPTTDGRPERTATASG